MFHALESVFVKACVSLLGHIGILFDGALPGLLRRDLWNNHPSPIYRKREEEVTAQLAQATWVASSISNPASKLEGPNSKF